MAPLFYDQYDLERKTHKGTLSNHIFKTTPTNAFRSASRAVKTVNN